MATGETMKVRFSLRRCRLGALLLGLLCPAALAPPAAAAMGDWRTLCDDNAPTCTEPFNHYNSYTWQYIGHDEPAVLFYSATPGSGNSSAYILHLPQDPPTPPKQNGRGGTDNFQLHPAFWFGMAMCDSQSAPNPGMACKPDTDANIFDSSDPASPRYIGKHPGTAFMEMQFYPPGWAPWPSGVSCDATRWCAALNIDSLSQNMNTGQSLNASCERKVGEEYVNFAFITTNGVAQAPANPVKATQQTFTPDPARDLFMNSGDVISVQIQDTPQGLLVVIDDLTTGDSGSMTASAANGFGQVKFAPTGSECRNIPYDFHPMYATSSEHTRVPWAAHSYNVVFSDEIGHFEYCDAVDAKGDCIRAGASDPGGVDKDDKFCFRASASLAVPITGCTGADVDFDGPPYLLDWPGTLRDSEADSARNPSPIQFTSPLFAPTASPTDLRNYDRVGFETDLPGIESQTKPRCNTSTGKNCVNPPAGARFYPFYTTTNASGFGCLWRLGGANLPNVAKDFGGSSTAEYGPLLQLAYPNTGNTAELAFEDFRRVLSSNPCPQSGTVLSAQASNE
jgi:hypothetical protein